MTKSQSSDTREPRITGEDVGSPSRKSTMRYATVVLDPGCEGFKPVCAACVDRAKISCERIHQINLLDDGTIVGLYQLRGESEHVSRELDDNPRVLSYDIAGTGDIHLYLHEEATDLAIKLLSVLDEYEILMDKPQDFINSGALRVTLLGTSESIQQAISEISNMVDVQLEETGKYRPEGRDLVSMLTDRQHQILRIAVEGGYYESPRRATYEDIAAEVDLSHATVAEHIQKIEATLLSQFVY